MTDTCEHGVEGFCMRCCRQGENKPSGDDDDRKKDWAWEDYQDDDPAPP